MLDFLRQEGIDESIIRRVEAYRAKYPPLEEDVARIPDPPYKYYGPEIWSMALTALLEGENLLLVGPKATGKNVLAMNLAAVFGRPEWDISFYLNIDAPALIGTDTFKNGQVSFRPGSIYSCALSGGFGVLDEINMAKNESLAVLHAALDFRRIIDVPGYERISLHPATRFVATMNYGYAGTRELNEALTSRFMVINMPVISGDSLMKLLGEKFPGMKDEWACQLALLFEDIRSKCDSGEISTRTLDLRGLLAAIGLVRGGLDCASALELGLVNKSFDAYERQLVRDIISVRISDGITAKELFPND